MKLRIDNCIAQKRHRFARGFVYDPSSKDKKIAIQQIKEQFTGEPYTDALKIKFVFHLKRPKNHFRTGKYSNELKKTAPVYPIGRIGDIDNFIKFYMDCMNKLVYLDDSQVIEIYAKKEYNDLDAQSKCKLNKKDALPDNKQCTPQQQPLHNESANPPLAKDIVKEKLNSESYTEIII